eukprot:3166173-Rhodomonas_salina.2
MDAGGHVTVVCAARRGHVVLSRIAGCRGQCQWQPARVCAYCGPRRHRHDHTNLNQIMISIASASGSEAAASKVRAISSLPCVRVAALRKGHHRIVKGKALDQEFLDVTAV